MINNKIKDDIKNKILNNLYENIKIHEARHLNNYKIKRNSDGTKGTIVRSRVHGNAYDIEWEDGKCQTLGRKTITNEKKYELFESDSVKPDEEKNNNEKEFIWEDDNIVGIEDKIKDNINKYMKEKYSLNENDLDGESVEEVKKSVKDYVDKEKKLVEEDENKNLVKVKDLKIGDKIKYNNGKTTVVVRDILKDRVLVSKPEGNHMFGISLFSDKYNDLDNRVEKVDEIEEGRYSFNVYDKERQKKIKDKLNKYINKSETENRLRKSIGDEKFDEMNDPMLKDGKDIKGDKDEN